MSTPAVAFDTTPWAGWPVRAGFADAVGLTGDQWMPLGCHSPLPEAPLPTSGYLASSPLVREVARYLVMMGRLELVRDASLFVEAGITCGAQVPVFAIGAENNGDAGVLAHVQSWTSAGFGLDHAAWHLAHGDLSPVGLDCAPLGRVCSPDEFAMLWALAGRTPETDPVLGAVMAWMRYHHAPLP